VSQWFQKDSGQWKKPKSGSFGGGRKNKVDMPVVMGYLPLSLEKKAKDLKEWKEGSGGSGGVQGAQWTRWELKE
jgi:hypothetical protein